MAGAPALSAEALMRSRFTAFALGDAAYLHKTHAPEKRRAFDPIAFAAAQADTEWLGLEILATEDGGPTDDTGIVEFVATSRRRGRISRLHERSRFRRDGAGWVYIDGIFDPAPTGAASSVAAPIDRAPKVGRNDPCPCGSGRKFKKCCGA